jgi:hypothetical protein
MGTAHEPSDAEQHDLQARTDHDDHADRPGALSAYERLIASHPDTPEAGRARAWIRHINTLGVHLADGRVVPVGDVLVRRRACPPPGPAAGRPAEPDDVTAATRGATRAHPERR